MTDSVVVTGGSGGIGTAVCARLASEGLTVCAVDRDEPSVDVAHRIIVDLAEPGAATAAFTDAAAALGKVDHIVNAVGVYDAATLDDFTWSAYQRNLDVNVRAPLEMLLAWSGSQSRRGGRAVNIASAGAAVGSRDLPYAISKAGLIGASRSLARSLAPRGLAVFAVSPGLIDTAMSQRMPPERRAEHAEATFAKRAGEPAEVADLVAFLVCGRSEYLSGTNIPVASGLTT